MEKKRRDPKELITVEEAAVLLHLTYNGAHKALVREGMGRMLGRTRVVTLRELEDYRRRCIRSNQLKLPGRKFRVSPQPILTDAELVA